MRSTSLPAVSGSATTSGIRHFVDFERVCAGRREKQQGIHATRANVSHRQRRWTLTTPTRTPIQMCRSSLILFASCKSGCWQDFSITTSRIKDISILKNESKSTLQRKRRKSIITQRHLRRRRRQLRTTTMHQRRRAAATTTTTTSLWSIRRERGWPR